MERVIIVHTLEQAMDALAAATELEKPVTLQSAPDAIFHAGSLYLLHMFQFAHAAFPKAQARFVLDCADTGADAVAAMQVGHKILRSSAAPETRAQLQDIASQCGVEIECEPFESLKLPEEGDAKALCRDWLAS